MLLSLIKDIFLRKSVTEDISAKFEVTGSVARKVLNVGGNSKVIAIPPQYDGWTHLLLDIDPRGNPDVLCDARSLSTLPPAQFDAIYCSHNLEHYFRHDVRKVLTGFRHVLRDDGFVHVRVPDMGELMKMVADKELDIEDFLYESPAGPIHVIDVIYGLGREIEESGSDFFAHKTGYTKNSLISHLNAAGFQSVYSTTGNLEIAAIAFKNAPSAYALELFGLPPQAA